MRVLWIRRPGVAETVKGKPIQIEGQELIPLVRVRDRMQRGASVGATRVAGYGSVIVSMEPVAALHRSQRGEQRVLIRDETARAVRELLLVAAFIGCVGLTLVALARRSRDSSG